MPANKMLINMSIVVILTTDNGTYIILLYQYLLYQIILHYKNVPLGGDKMTTGSLFLITN